MTGLAERIYIYIFTEFHRRHVDAVLLRVETVHADLMMIGVAVRDESPWRVRGRR